MQIQLEKVIEAAKAGGTIITTYFGQALQTEQKSNAGDLRTKADTESEAAIIAVLSAAYPEANIYAEESGKQENGSDYTFVIDPLDGTNNFVLGIPDFSISIGLLHDHEAVLGVIYNPVLDQIFTAEKGRGAFQNGRPIHVNDIADLPQVTLSYTCGYNTSRDYNDRVIDQLQDLGVKRILNSWAPAYDYCLLASGRIEAVLSKEGDLEDYVAAKIIVREAGGKVTDFSGRDGDDSSPDFIASNGTTLHDHMLHAVA